MAQPILNQPTKPGDIHMPRRQAPSFMGLHIASILIRIAGGISIVLGSILVILILSQIGQTQARAGVIIGAMMPGVAVLLWGIFMYAAGEALVALKIIAESTDETAYVLRRKLG
jgi:hypothetical protein